MIPVDIHGGSLPEQPRAELFTRTLAPPSPHGFVITRFRPRVERRPRWIEITPSGWEWLKTVPNPSNLSRFPCRCSRSSESVVRWMRSGKTVKKNGDGELELEVSVCRVGNRPVISALRTLKAVGEVDNATRNLMWREDIREEHFVDITLHIGDLLGKFTTTAAEKSSACQMLQFQRWVISSLQFFRLFYYHYFFYYDYISFQYFFYIHLDHGWRKKKNTYMRNKNFKRSPQHYENILRQTSARTFMSV